MDRRRTKNDMVQILDRRVGSERRRAKRYRVTIEIDWEGSRGPQTGTISDISELGCFVLCSGDVEDGSVVKLFVPLSGGMKGEFNGEVTNHLIEVGFAARFVDLTPAQKDFLANLVEMHKE